MLPSSLIEPLKLQLQKAQSLHQQDLTLGYGSVELPTALERKYPNANRAWIWQFVFPSWKRSVIYTHVLNRGGQGVRSP